MSERAQEQLEQLWIEEEENETTLETVDPIISNELRQMGLVEAADAQLRLTHKGKAEAGRAIRRHRLAERLFMDVLSTDVTQIDEQACRMEHALFDGVDDAICTLLGHPHFCPHGKPIPPGKCCEQMRSSVSQLIAPVCDLKMGQSGRIAYIQMNDPDRLQKLMAMGVLPGVDIKLLATSPSYVFEAGYSQFAVDSEIAADIYVRLSGV